MIDSRLSPSAPLVMPSSLLDCTSQLPVSSYFDDVLYQREMALLFKNGPRYVGHRLAVPQVGDFYSLPQESGGRALVHTPNGVELISNVCRHRQALILQGRGSLPPQSGGNIVCPLHRWTYAASGQVPAGTLLGAPHFDVDPCLNLHNYPLTEWNGLLFERNPAGGQRDVAADMADLAPRAALDFTGYALDHVEMHACNYNWKTFIEVYLEDYHVGPFHPGLGQFVTCEDLRWEFGRHHSVQTVGVHHALERPGSAVYQRWHDAVLKYRNGVAPAHGAIWLTYYPTVMLEWYPHVLVVSTLVPRGPRHTTNLIEFFYPEDISAFERDYIDAQQAAYLETSIEDDEIALRMDAGRQALYERGDDEAGPYQSPMEDGMQQFHAWYRGQMGGGLAR